MVTSKFFAVNSVQKKMLELQHRIWEKIEERFIVFGVIFRIKQDYKSNVFQFLAESLQLRQTFTAAGIYFGLTERDQGAIYI